MTLKNVFICYRREEAEGYATRLYDRLNSRFPKRVFKDVAGIGPGADATQVIEDRVGACHALVAVIGSEWLMILDEDYRRRLFSDDDHVRREIASALARDIPVIPVLVQGAKMPSAELLPPDLAALSVRDPFEITDSNFDYDVNRLIHSLENLFGEQKPVAPAPPVKAVRNNFLLLVIALLVVGIGIFLVVRMFRAERASKNSHQASLTPIHSPSPEPSASEPPATDFEPVGSWAFKIGNAQPGEIDLHEDHTYQATDEHYDKIEGTWQYSPADGKLTLKGFFEDDGEATRNAEIKIEHQSGNQYFGQLITEGATTEFWIRPR
jgi:hypothetical protein